jgi:hypothetical protein
MIRIILALSAWFLSFQCLSPAYAAVDWQKVEQVLGRKAATLPGDVHRFGFPRSDLNVTLDGVEIKRRWRSDRGWLSKRLQAALDRVNTAKL